MIISFFLGLLVYMVALFPAILLYRAYGKSEERYTVSDSEDFPTVDLLIAAKNEEAVLREKLENSLALDYPKAKLRIVVLANGCTDATEVITREFEKQGVVLMAFEDVGKTEAQNRAAADSNSEILAFSDANTLYEPDALKQLIAPFADETIGSVSGRHRYRLDDRATSSTEGTFWNVVETSLKRAESKTGGLIGANGSIYAVRRDLYIPLPPEVISDFIEPLLIASHGHRTVFAENAIAWETAEKNLLEESRRKERIVQRSVASLLKYPELLNPAKHGRLSFLLWSHKVLRWLTPFFVGALLLASTLNLLFGRGKRTDIALFGGGTLLGFFALLGRGLGTSRKIPLLTEAFYIALMLRAALMGVIRAVSEGSRTTWNPTR